MTPGEPALDEIYKEVILDHYRNPRNRGHLDDATATADGLNPLCGDEIHVELRVADGRIAAVAFTGRGCSISQSSASLMTEAIEGLAPAEALQKFDAFKAMLSGGPHDDLGDLDALSGVAKLPVRVKCATLAWNTLKQALGA